MSKFVEPVIDKMKSLLDSNLAGKLNAIDTAEDDGVVLEDVVKVWKGGMPQTFELPAIVIWPVETSGGSDFTNVTYEYAHEIIIWVVLKGDAPEETHIRLWRTMQGIFDVIKADDNLGGTVDICEFKGFRYDTPWAFTDDDMLLGIGGVVFGINHEEQAE